jgi:hypothetical protein
MYYYIEQIAIDWNFKVINFSISHSSDAIMPKFIKHNLWFTVSNALERSRKIPIVNSFRSIADVIFRTNH